MMKVTYPQPPPGNLMTIGVVPRAPLKQKELIYLEKLEKCWSLQELKTVCE